MSTYIFINLFKNEFIPLPIFLLVYYTILEEN